MRLSVSLTLRRETETEGVESVYRMVYAQDWFMVVLVEIGGNLAWQKKHSHPMPGTHPNRHPTKPPPYRPPPPPRRPPEPAINSCNSVGSDLRITRTVGGAHALQTPLTVSFVLTFIAASSLVRYWNT